MISFEIPWQIQQNMAVFKKIAVEVMRPHSRWLDENEHERPSHFIGAMWPLVKDQYHNRLEQLESDQDTAVSIEPRWELLEELLMVEQLSWGDTGQYLCRPTPSLGGSAIDAVATLAQKTRFYERWRHDPPKWGSMAITEPGAGSDNSAIRTTARLDSETNEWVINGEKIFITNGKLALDESNGLCVVWATIDPQAGRAGIKSFVIEAGTPGVIIAKQEDKLGIRASDTVSLKFEETRIPFDNLLGTPTVNTPNRTTKGFKGAMQTFNASRPRIAASALGIARATIELTRQMLAEEGITVNYRLPRHQWTAVQLDLIEMEARYKVAWNLTLKATAKMIHGQDNRLEASMCKCRAGEAVTWITQKAVALLGPLGYSRELLVEKWMRDAKINDIYEGTRQINQLIVARALLGYSRRELM